MFRNNTYFHIKYSNTCNSFQYKLEWGEMNEGVFSSFIFLLSLSFQKTEYIFYAAAHFDACIEFLMILTTLQFSLAIRKKPVGCKLVIR